MIKMTVELAQCFECKNIRLMDAKTGNHIESFNGEKISELYLLGNDYSGFTVYNICPGSELDGTGARVETLQIWIDPEKKEDNEK